MEYNRKQKSLSPIDILKFGTVNTGTTFKQYDINTSILELELVANGEPVHLTDEKVYVTVKSSSNSSTQLLSKYSGISTKEKDNYKVLLRAKKSRRRDVNNIIDVYISPLALENSGEMIAEVMIIDLIKEERVTSQSFTFNIEPSITPNRPSESAYKIVKDLDGTYITDAEDVQLLVAEVEPNFKLSFVGTRVNEILEKANNFDIEDNTNKIQTLQEKDVELESKISNLEQKDSSLDGEIASLKSSDQSIEEEIQGLKTKDESIESEISQLKSKDTLIDGEIDKLKNADETIKADINSKYEELKQKTDSTNNEIVRLKAQDTTLSESIRTNKGLIDVINPKVATLEQDSQNVKNRVSVLEGDMNLAKSNISTLQRSNTEISQKVEGVEQGNASINEILEQLQRDVESYKSSIELLESKVPVWKDFKGESFKVENSFYGKSRDLSIKGKTLQNLITGGNVKMVIDKSLGEGGNNRIHQRFTSYNLTPGKTYIGYINITKFEGSCQYGLRIYGISNNGANAYFTVATSVGWHKFVWKTQDTTDGFNLIGVYMYSNDYDNGCKITCDSFMLFEQNSETNNLNLTNYFDGIKSLGEQEGNKISILSHGKNLCDFQKSKLHGSLNAYITEKNGEFSFTVGVDDKVGWFAETDNIKLEEGAYNISIEVKAELSSGYQKFWYGVYYFDINGKSLGYGGTYVNTTNSFSRNNISITAPKDVAYGKFRIYNYSNIAGTITFRKPQLEKEAMMTSYEDYIQDKKDILLSELGFDEGLRGIDDSIYDELDDLRNISIKRVGKYTFTGNENWFLGTQSQGWGEFDDSLVFYSHPFTKSSVNSKFICNLLPYVNVVNENIVGICNHIWGSEPHPVIRVKKSDLSQQNIEGFKAWLKEKGITIYYELAKQVETPLNNDINFGTLDDITYVSLENNIKNELSCQCQVSLASSKA